MRFRALDAKPAEQCERHPPSRRVYTDGSCAQGGKQLSRKKKQERQQRATQEPKAGWAYVVISMRPCSDAEAVPKEGCEGEVRFAECGQVGLTPGEPGYRGATRHTNNTGELTALLRAIETERSRQDGRSVEFCTDSLHAMRVAIGATTKGKANRELKRRVRAAYVGLCERRGHRRVSVRHVYAHNRLAGNETADKLAKAGANNEAAGSGTDVLERAKAIYDEYATCTGDPQNPPSHQNSRQWVRVLRDAG